jgi:hypothetical protein
LQNNPYSPSNLNGESTPKSNLHRLTSIESPHPVIIPSKRHKLPKIINLSRPPGVQCSPKNQANETICLFSNFLPLRLLKKANAIINGPDGKGSENLEGNEKPLQEDCNGFSKV